MKSAVETLSPTRVKLTVEVPFEELKPALDNAYKRIAAQINVPGFRKGKVPARIIDQRLGRGAVLEEAVNEAVGTSLDEAIREHEVRLLSRPEVEVGELKDNAPLEFTAEADVIPDFEMPSYEGIEVTVDPSEVTDEDVDKQLDALRERFGSLLPADRAAVAGDVLLVDLSGQVDGEIVDDLVASALSYELGTEGMLPGFDEAVDGASAGETRTFSFTAEAGDYEGRAIDVTVKVSAVRERQLPDADDDFAQLASEFDTIDELRADLRERVARVKVLEQAYAARNLVAEKLLEAADVPMPENLIEAQLTEHFEDGHGDDDHRSEVETEVRNGLKSQLVLDRIADAEQVSVSEAELSQWLVSQAPRYGVSPDVFAQQLVESGQVPAAVAEVRRGKALSRVLELAKVTDSAGAVVDITAAIRPDLEDVEYEDFNGDYEDDEYDDDED